MAHDLRTVVQPRRRSILRKLDWERMRAGRLPGLWTEEEYLAVDVNRRIEFTDGVIDVMPLPDLIHQTVQNLIWTRLYLLRIDGRAGYATTAGLKLKLRSGKWREPDVLYLKPENDRLAANESWTYADFVVEVVSKDHPTRDTIRKRREYARWGIPEYWVVDPRAQTLLQLVLDPGTTEYREVGTFRPGDVVRSATLPGFEIDFAALLAEAERAAPPA